MKKFIEYLGVLADEEYMDIMRKEYLLNEYNKLRKKEKVIFNKIIEDNSYVLLEKYIQKKDYDEMTRIFKSCIVRDDFHLLSTIISELQIAGIKRGHED